MSFGPILCRDLAQMARRTSTYGRRAGAALLLLAVIGGCSLTAYLSRWDHTSIARQVQFSSITFGIVIAIQALWTLGSIPPLIGPAIAIERERKSLDALLTTRLSNAEIVVSTILVGLAKALSGLILGFGVIALMSPLWGIDPRPVLMSYVGLLAASYFVAGLSALAAVEARTSRSAAALAATLWVAWLGVPVLMVFLLPRFWPWGATWLMPIALPLLDSSPMVVVLAIGGVVGRGSYLDTVWRLVGLDLAGGTMLILWAIVRLRRASRSAYDNETLALIRRLTRPIRWRRHRPPCGDDPVLWYEMHKARYKTAIQWLTGNLVGVSLVAGYLVVMWWLARPAFDELQVSGYRAHSQRIKAPEFHPFVRWLVLGIHSGPPAGQARAELNTVVRQATSAFYVMFLIVTTGFAVESITSERDRDTWSGLLATPLSACEILRAKMLGALWRTRWYIALTVGTWILALGVGALHPLGIAASLVVLVATGWFCSSLGTYAALAWQQRETATNMVLVVLLLAFSGLVLLVLPPRGISILMGAGSIPLVGWISVLTYDDVEIAIRTGAFPRLRAGGIQTGEGALYVLATYLVAVSAYSVGALLLTKATLREFDLRVGRPVRSTVPVEAISENHSAEHDKQLAVAGG